MTARDTPVTFSRAEVAAIRKQFDSGAGKLECPRCKVVMLVGQAIPVGKRQIIEAICPSCEHCLMMSSPSEGGTAAG